MSDNQNNDDLTNPPDTASGGAPEEPDKPSKADEPDRTEQDGTPVENPSG